MQPIKERIVLLTCPPSCASLSCSFCCFAFFWWICGCAWTSDPPNCCLWTTNCSPRLTFKMGKFVSQTWVFWHQWSLFGSLIAAATVNAKSLMVHINPWCLWHWAWLLFGSGGGFRSCHFRCCDQSKHVKNLPLTSPNTINPMLPVDSNHAFLHMMHCKSFTGSSNEARIHWMDTWLGIPHTCRCTSFDWMFESKQKLTDLLAPVGRSHLMSMTGSDMHC